MEREEIIKRLKKAIEICEKDGAVSIILSINHERTSTNIVIGAIKDMATALASQSKDIEDSTIPIIEKAIGIAKIIY